MLQSLQSNVRLGQVFVLNGVENGGEKRINTWYNFIVGILTLFPLCAIINKE